MEWFMKSPDLSDRKYCSEMGVLRSSFIRSLCSLAWCIGNFANWKTLVAFRLDFES